MHISDLIEGAAEAAQCTPLQAAAIVRGIPIAVHDSLVHQEPVYITGLGYLEARAYPARWYRDPHTHEMKLSHAHFRIRIAHSQPARKRERAEGV